MEKIVSPHNGRIKDIIRLSKPQERNDKNLTIVEGYREISMAYHAGFQIKEIYYSNEIHQHPQAYSMIDSIPHKFEISKQVFEKIAYREHSDGLIALAVPKYLTVDNLSISANPIL